ncbi:3-phenylpropionate/trans-cinnamate dioxygenase ferredoxin reductase subunit [Lewinella aquimaris]|uniref:3-phenylpropionate/trans-cinnamate dioxygenase ferredoxin reductase subunit n=1 Tax=Neolewinella aquimaris TaxID=1835722 RepID=A0A840E509_9BACT|nr:FAD-dependent oxidoreductase [Neolewinella aquimaris]MBB4080724.1 3-phenylpropionate/trans-cinnamate dioxygenase ferredoxin reductase subunit [Neolewinella aquimaris]
MAESPEEHVCLIVGASHAGVGCAFELRRQGWTGGIVLIDRDPQLPYHRPPLSKTYLTSEEGSYHNPLRAVDNYEREGIELRLGVSVASIDRDRSLIVLDNGEELAYDKLVLATGARPLIPPFPGLESARHVFSLRTAADVAGIRAALSEDHGKRVVVIGGGYIGLETAASLRKLGAEVTVLEREERVLARVTTPGMSAFFEQLHADHGVKILTGKTVSGFQTNATHTIVRCADGDELVADVIVIGVGIRVNVELAQRAGLEVSNGICVNGSARTSDENIYAIGDCTYHHNPRYDRFVRLESVQNAVDQGKVAAAALVGKVAIYDAIPWFWSDQYDVKLQIVGLSEGHDRAVVRKEVGEAPKFSIWYFAGDTLLAVDAVNNAKAYVIGTKFIQSGALIDRDKLADPTVPLRPANLVR